MIIAIQFAEGGIRHMQAKRQINQASKLLGVLMLALSAAAQAVAPVAVSDDHAVRLEIGVHKLLRQVQPVRRVAVGDPAIADVTVINRREVLIIGKKIGITSLLIWPKASKGGSAATAEEFRLRVVAVIDPLKAKNRNPELAKVQIDPRDGLSGSLPNLLAHRSARVEASLQAQAAGVDKAAVVADRSTVDLETQVMTEVKIVEVKRTTLQQYGLNVLKNSSNTVAGLSAPGSISGANPGGLPNNPQGYLSGTNLPIANAFNLVIGDPRQGLLGILSFLEGKGLARTYAEPTLTAMSGQTASFLAGGEFPVPVSQGGSTGGITIQYREFGVRLSLTPTVLSRNRIALKVAPEVSDLDFSAGITTAGVSVPALSVRRTDTTVELGDGESFVISGLVSNTLVNNVNKVPWLGDVPILGAFFKNNSVNRTEKELVMIVTPHLVRPLARDARRPPLPGAATDNYRPSFGQLMFQETGHYDAAQFGYSK